MVVLPLYKLHALTKQKSYGVEAINIVCIFIKQGVFFHKLPLCPTIFDHFNTLTIDNPNHMKLLFSITFLLFYTSLFSQDDKLLEQVFTDKSNFEITTFLDNKKPKMYFVLSKTDKWNSYRFYLDRDLTSDSIRRSMERDEHSPYNHSYLFKDTVFKKLFSETEKQRLYQQTLLIKPRQLSDTFKEFKLIKSYNSAKNGFFFSVTDPIFTADKQYCFIDITTFKKDKETEELRFAYFGHTLLIYQNVKGKSWTRIKKMDYIIL